MLQGDNITRCCRCKKILKGDTKFLYCGTCMRTTANRNYKNLNKLEGGNKMVLSKEQEEYNNKVDDNSKNNTQVEAETESNKNDKKVPQQGLKKSDIADIVTTVVNFIDNTHTTLSDKQKCRVIANVWKELRKRF